MTTLFEATATRPDEAQCRERIAEQLERERALWLDIVRGHMRRLYCNWYAQHGDAAFVTPDHARAVFESQRDAPGPEVSRNFLAQVFRGPEWEEIGTTKSINPGSHANRIGRYRWVGVGSPNHRVSR